MTHLLEAWPSVSARLRAAERLLLLLDFDGTLAPIVAHPPDARAPARALDALRALRALPHVSVAVVSGRGVRDVRKLLGLEGIHYFGSHGRERLRPGDPAIEAPAHGPEALRALCARLAADLAGVAGFRLENKGLSVAAHYRNAAPQDRERVARAVRRAVADAPGLQAAGGKMVFDITPTDGIDKGTAVSGLLRECGGLPLYFGDDTTDESAFRALPAEAVTVFVGPASRSTAARYRVADPAEVSEALCRILGAARR